MTADIARSLDSKVYYSKVGEANVIQLMRQRQGIIGGEGNGGVIYPKFHAGRDSLIAAALTLSCLAVEKVSLKELVESLPRYYIKKSKAALPDDFSKRLREFEKKADNLLGRVKVDRQDGLRFDFKDGWVQIRTSNTEPIYRLIVETKSPKFTQTLHRAVSQFFK
jgi:phosphomannomutase